LAGRDFLAIDSAWGHPPHVHPGDIDLRRCQSEAKVEAVIEQARAQGAMIGLAHNPGWTLHANVTISLE
jgi:hypothetical protein